jgi:hypothetical protein
MEKDRNEASIPLLAVEVIVDDGAFPIYAASLIGRDLVFDTLSVHSRADDEDESGILRAKLFVAPVGPTLWRTDVVAVHYGIDTMASELVRECKNPVAVLGRIVTVTDEHPTFRRPVCCCHFFSPAQTYPRRGRSGFNGCLYLSSGLVLHTFVSIPQVMPSVKTLSRLRVSQGQNWMR